MIDERELEYLKPYSKLYENVLHINKAMERQEWKTAAKYCRDALAEMVVQIYWKYSCEPVGKTLWDNCKILEMAKVISPQSMSHYDAIRICGNAADHPEDPKYRSYVFNEERVMKVVKPLLEETIIFVESYSVDLIPNGKMRIMATQAMVLNGGGANKKVRHQYLSPFLVRVISVFRLLAAVFFWKAFCSNIPSDAGGVEMFASLVLIMFGFMGLYGLITGDDRLIIINSLWR